MIVDSGASCNVIDRKLWVELKQIKVKCVSMKFNKKLYPYGSAEPLKTAVCFDATITKPSIIWKRDSYTAKCLAPWLGSWSYVLKQEDIFDKYKMCFRGLGKLKDFELDIPFD